MDPDSSSNATESNSLRSRKLMPNFTGPGVQPILPKANPDFWSGSGHPTSMWEATVCPVTDVAAFLSDPLRCIFGDGGGTIISKLLLLLLLRGYDFI